MKKVIASHIGTNPETGRQMIAGEMEVELVPQGTLAERVRAGGSGLGGILTPTGVGTVVEEGKEKITVDGREYLLEKPLRAEVALLKAYKADKAGNLVYHRSARNFNPFMALAADLVIVQVEKLVEVGEIDPDDVMTPESLWIKFMFREVVNNDTNINKSKTNHRCPRGKGNEGRRCCEPGYRLTNNGSELSA